MTFMANERILFLPHAGGAGEMYFPWFKFFAPHLECQFVELPGRGRLFTTAAIDNMQDMLDYLLPNIIAVADKPLSLFGHSMGALIAFRLAHELAKRDIVLKHLFVSGHRSPRQPYRRKLLHLMGEQELLEEIKPMGGMEDVDLELLTAFLPALYSDFKLCETYSSPDEQPLSCPITVFWGDNDEYIQRETIELWSQESTNKTLCYPLPGGHFFIKENRGDIIKIINHQLRG